MAPGPVRIATPPGVTAIAPFGFLLATLDDVGLIVIASIFGDNWL